MPRWPRIVAHADMDAFYACVEQLDDPSLRGKPILIGHESGRGVVLTASYEARPSGVGSAMPMSRARRLCPEALIVPPRFERYSQVSQQIMEAFADFSPSVEPISLDEAFLEMTGAEHLFGTPGAMGRRIKEAVRDATGGLTVSVGISGTKYVAKVASDFRKPDGLTVVPPWDAVAFLAPLPIRRLWGAGPVTTARIEALGLHTIGELAAADPDWLRERLGNAGPHFWRLAHAQDPRHVEGRRRAVSIGSERTLETDIVERADIEPHLRRSAEEIGRRLRKKGTLAGGVRVKLKTSSFKLMTRQKQLHPPTDLAQRLYEEGLTLLPLFDYDERFRLVGLAAYDLVKPDAEPQLDLFAPQAGRRKLEGAMDAIRGRFGAGAIQRADELGRPIRKGPNLDFLDE